MGIKVQVEDGLVEIGGDFKSALDFVKGFDRSDCDFNGQTKVWTLKTSLEALSSQLKGFLPFDVLSGNAGSGVIATGAHVTRYGNSYTENEWRATQEVRQVTLEKDYDAQLEAAYQQLIADFRATGTPDAMCLKIAQELRTGMSCLEDLESQGPLRFTSNDRRQAFLAAETRYVDTVARICEEELQERAAKEEEIWEKYGVR